MRCRRYRGIIKLRDSSLVLLPLEHCSLGVAVEKTLSLRMGCGVAHCTSVVGVCVVECRRVEATKFEHPSSQGELEEAEGLYRQATAVAEDVLGRDHPELATRLHKRAAILMKMVSSLPLVVCTATVVHHDRQL